MRRCWWLFGCTGLLSCTADHQDFVARESFVPAPPVTRVLATPQIEHRKMGNTRLLCDVSTGARMSQACAVWNVKTNVCTIISEPHASHEVLGHEVRHCFEGYFH